MVAKTIGFSLSFIVPLLLVRLLNQTEFGLYKQTFLVLATWQAILPLNVVMSAFYYFPREEDRKGVVVLNILLFHAAVGLAGCLVLIAWPSVLTVLVGSSELTAYASLIGSVLCVTILASLLEVIAIANQEARLSAALIVGAQLSKAGFMLAAIAWHASLETILYASLCQGIMQTVALLWYLRSRFPGYWRMWNSAFLGRQLSYAVPLGVAGLVYTLQTVLHHYLVARRFGPSLYAVYAIGFLQPPLVDAVRDSVGSVTIPRVSLLSKLGRPDEIVRLIGRGMRMLAAFILPIYAFLLVSGYDLLVALYTQDYAASWPILLVSLTLLPLRILLIDPVLRAYAEQRVFLLRLKLILLVVLIVALFASMAWAGMMGAAACVVAVSLVERAILTWRLVRILNPSYANLTFLTAIGKLAMASAVSALVTALIRIALPPMAPLSSLAASGSVFALIYGASVIGLRIPEPEENAAVRRQLRRLLPVR
jgi:O-antigen/teichoic acid export membrane protein